MKFSSQLILAAVLPLLTLTSNGVDDSSLYYRSSPDISKATQPERISRRLLPHLDCYLDDVSEDRRAAFAVLRMPCMETATLLALEEHDRKSITNNPV